MQSRFFENAVAEILDKCGEFSELKLRRAMANSTMISSDVGAAFDPMHADVYDKRSNPFFGKGMVLNKHTGSRGKGGSNDANAEYIARLRHVFDENQVAFQLTEMGKIDAGGGVTVAAQPASITATATLTAAATPRTRAPANVRMSALTPVMAWLRRAP